MLNGIISPIVAQLLLVAVLIAATVFVLRVVTTKRKRVPLTQMLSTLPEADVAALAEELPQLNTQYRVSAPVTRLVPPAQLPAPPIVEIRLGKRPVQFTPVDITRPNVPERYESAQGKTADATDVALFALCTLEEGGADAIQSQIKDFDKVKDAPSVVRLVPTQTVAGDYIVIARVLSHRRDNVSEGVSVIAYRAEVIKNADTHLVIELAVPDEGQTPFADGTMVHGTARLYGYLP
ncbi:MAG: hypothetical protein H7145_02445 [Akkermansiaceae bacterium]|nr:hypothetical protein [Armatimonadota bacterium]